jgi:hypothetical protein
VLIPNSLQQTLSGQAEAVAHSVPQPGSHSDLEAKVSGRVQSVITVSDMLCFTISDTNVLCTELWAVAAVTAFSWSLLALSSITHLERAALLTYHNIPGDTDLIHCSLAVETVARRRLLRQVSATCFVGANGSPLLDRSSESNWRAACV